MNAPIGALEMARLVASARNRIDTVTPAIPDRMTRTEVAELAMGVGLAMAAGVLRDTLPLDPSDREQVAASLAQTAAQLGVPTPEAGP